MDAFPIFFGTRDAVLGNGFVARVSIDGRALMFEEDGRWWVVGVEPGGIAADGATEAEAYMAFREAIRKVLQDSAQLTDGFDAFCADVKALANQVDNLERARWEEARQQVRAGGGLPEGFVGGLPRLKTDPPCRTVVEQIKTPAATKPEPPRLEVQAAA